MKNEWLDIEVDTPKVGEVYVVMSEDLVFKDLVELREITKKESKFGVTIEYEFIPCSLSFVAKDYTLGFEVRYFLPLPDMSYLKTDNND